MRPIAPGCILISLMAAHPGLAAAQSMPGPLAQALAPAPLATLPPAPPPIGLPLLQSQASCPALQQRVQGIVGAEAPVWSITVADGQGRLLADLNGLRPRVPASNQKLVSTAYALDQLGPDYRLNTQLWRLGDGSFRLMGEGDPDLALPQLQRFARLALARSSSEGRPSLVRLQLAEEPSQAWWPAGWHPDDRLYAYGAPITRLALTSNAIQSAVPNPPSRLRALLNRALLQQGGQAQLNLVSARAPLPDDAELVHQEPSAPMHNLLSLANTESHNFTAEVLLRQGAGTWDLQEARWRTQRWLSEQGLPMVGVRVADGSGLDRANRLTSRFLAALLLRMNQHPYASLYLASMAVAGRRGTLRNLYIGTPIEGRLYAKTGTLTGVRAISGLLETADGPRYVSAISNGGGSPNSTIGAVLRQVMNTRLCPLTLS